MYEKIQITIAPRVRTVFIQKLHNLTRFISVLYNTYGAFIIICCLICDKVIKLILNGLAQVNDMNTSRSHSFLSPSLRFPSFVIPFSFAITAILISCLICSSPILNSRRFPFESIKPKFPVKIEPQYHHSLVCDARCATDTQPIYLRKYGSKSIILMIVVI